MEKKNGKQVVRIGVLGKLAETRKRLIKTICRVCGSSSPDFHTSSISIEHGKFKVGFKEIEVETEKYYYQFIYYLDFVADASYIGLNLEKCLLLGAAKPDLFLIAFDVRAGLDNPYLGYINTLRIPLAGIFIHYDKPDDNEEEEGINPEELEHAVRERIEMSGLSVLDNYRASDLNAAMVDPKWAQEVKYFVLELDEGVGNCLQEAKNDRLYNGPKDTKKVDTWVFTPCKSEGYDNPLESSQEVAIEFSSIKLKATITKTDGEKFEDARKIISNSERLQAMSLHLKEQAKVGRGDRFLIKVNGRIDGIGIVNKVHY